MFIQFEDFMGKGNQDDIEVNEGMDIYIYIFFLGNIFGAAFRILGRTTTNSNNPSTSSSCIVSLRTWAPVLLVLRYLPFAPSSWRKHPTET